MIDLLKILWLSINPILQLILVTSIGLMLTYKHVLSPTGSKLLAKVYILALVPSLLFSKLVTAVTPNLLARMVVIVPFVLLYMCVGCLGGVLIRYIWRDEVPENLYGTFIVLGAWSNWGDLPLAVLLTLTSSSPFSVEDSNLVVAYVAVFIIIFNVTLFPLGGHLLIKKDYYHLHPIPPSSASTSVSIEIETERPVDEFELQHTDPSSKTKFQTYVTAKFNRRGDVYLFFQQLCTPVNLATLFGLIVGLTDLKYLFVASERNPWLVLQTTLPPLHFLFTTTTFVGQAAVPLGLINLGSALLKQPKLKSNRDDAEEEENEAIRVDDEINHNKTAKVPLKVCLAFVLLKLVLTPISGFGSVVLALNYNFIERKEKVLILTLLFASTVPSATSTLLLTQLYHPEGKADNVGRILVVQYLFATFTLLLGLCLSFWLIF